MAIFYQTIYRDYGIIYKNEQNDCNTQGVIDCINYMIENNISRDVHLTIDDAYSEILKDFKNRINILEYYIDNISDYITKTVEDFNIFEFKILREEKIKYFRNKILGIEDYINNFEINVILKDFTLRNEPNVYRGDILQILGSDKINILLK